MCDLSNSQLTFWNTRLYSPLGDTFHTYSLAFVPPISPTKMQLPPVCSATMNSTNLGCVHTLPIPSSRTHQPFPLPDVHSQLPHLPISSPDRPTSFSMNNVPSIERQCTPLPAKLKPLHWILTSLTAQAHKQGCHPMISFFT